MQQLDDLLKASIGTTVLERVRKKLLLPETRRRFTALPPVILLLLFSSRSGSTYAARLLAKTPYFRSVREAFNVSELAIIRKRHKLSDDAAAARKVVELYSTETAFAAKCGAPGLAGAYLVGFLETVFGHARFIQIKRRDRVAQAVSLVKAELSGRFHSNAEAKCVVTADQYDRERIGMWCDVIGTLDQSLADFAAANRPAPVFWYEDICADPAGFVDAALETAGLPPANLTATDVGLSVLRDDINAEWIARFNAGR